MKVLKLIIHHSATTDNQINNWDAIRKYHMDVSKWSDIGYHYGLEMVNGKLILQKGRDETTIGAHCIGMNKSSLGICCVGNYDLIKPCDKMFDALADLCFLLCRKYSLIGEDIEPHNKYANKSCPGKMFPMAKLKMMVNKKLLER